MSVQLALGYSPDPSAGGHAGTTALPGFPATDLFDEHGPWQHALAAAADFGAPVRLFERRIAEHGLLIPAALLENGGWPTLWRRAHR